MSIFQYLALTLLGLLVVAEIIALARGWTRRGIGLLRLAVWLLAGVAIADPNLVQHIASAVGIGRGADAVLYLFVLAFLVTAFYFYSRQVKLQRQVTELLRHIAIQEARRGGS